MKRHLISLLILSFSIFCSAQSSMNVTKLFNWTDTTPSKNFYGAKFNDTWGFVWKGKEYAVIGSTLGTHIFDVTNPASSFLKAFIIGADTGSGIIHRDFKVYKNYLYGVCDEGSSTLQIIDFSYLPDSVKLIYNSNVLLMTTHNIFIDTAKGRLYGASVRHNDFSFSAMEIFSLANPENPTFLYAYNNGDHVHDVYVRNDTAYCNSGNLGLEVMDFSNIASPSLIGSLTTYPDQGYNHSGWLGDDGKTLVFADETHGMGLKLCDVTNLSDIKPYSQLVYADQSDTNSIPHNPFIKGKYLFIAYYYDGLQIFDISNPSNPFKVGFYDTYPDVNDASYRGAWGTYPYLPSGNILVADMEYGLFVLDASVALSGIKEKEKNNFAVSVSPNPFENKFTANFSLEKNQQITVEISDLLGKIIFSKKSLYYSGNNSENIFTGLPVPCGMYLLKLKGEKEIVVTKVIKTK